MKYDMVAFDLDGVIVAERSSWEWVHRHFGVDNKEALDAFIDGKIDDFEFMRRDILLWLDKKPGLTLKDINEVLKGARVIKGSAETICALKEKGARTCIISGGIDLLADHIGADCGIDKVLANGLDADEDGRILGDGILRVELRDKASALRSVLEEFRISPENCAAVGNSWADVSMFKVAGFSIAFNPLDERTRNAADVVVESDDLKTILTYLE
jgi:phosphoserine phosphatase